MFVSVAVQCDVHEERERERECKRAKTTKQIRKSTHDSLVAKLFATSLAPMPQATANARKEPTTTILRSVRCAGDGSWCALLWHVCSSSKPEDHTVHTHHLMSSHGPSLCEHTDREISECAYFCMKLR